MRALRWLSMRVVAIVIALSMGWGLQSFGLAAMVALGELPMVDVAIHSDTGHERAATYEFAATWTPWLEERGVRVVTVRAADTRVMEFLADGQAAVAIPAYMTDGQSDGQVRRHCTQDWKIDPIRRWLQAHRARQSVELWLGITTDEVARIKPSNVQYIVNRWPFVEKRWRRLDVAGWLTAHGIAVPGRSACFMCPFQSRKEWHGVQESPDWVKAVAVDAAIRDARPVAGRLYLHRSMVPLPMVDFRSEQEKGQMDLWDAECSGHCGL